MKPIAKVTSTVIDISLFVELGKFFLGSHAFGGKKGMIIFNPAENSLFSHKPWIIDRYKIIH
jgi:hypothetical protein